jgi:transcriptional regulator with XRE-family HTH domain
MHDPRLGAAFRAVRIRRGWRQSDVAERARCSRWVVSEIERGHIARTTLERLLSVAAVLEIRISVIPRWRGGDLDRLLNARHSALGERVARYLASRPGWTFAPEVSFAIGAERGVIDILAWHQETRSLLVIELKTEVVDVQETLGTLDRKRRLAMRVARERGWYPATVSVWLIVADDTSNRRRVAAHKTILRAALPADGWQLRRWLRDPGPRAVAGHSLWAYAGDSNAKCRIAARKRVRRPSAPTPTKGAGAVSDLPTGERRRSST